MLGLDVVGGIDVLSLHAPPELDGAEIEVSLVADAPGPRTHSQVRQRLLPDRVQYAAVYPDLPAGDYVIWRDASTQAAVVTITPATVTTTRWPA